MLPLLFVLALHAEIKSVVADGSQLSSIPAQTFADAAARFGVAHPERLLAALAKHDLASSLADVAELDGTERAELRAALTVAGVSIGDRSRLRRLADIYLESGITGNEANEDSGRSDVKLAPLPKWTVDEDTAPQERHQLQEGGKTSGDDGLSGDSLALVATAILGMASFLVQARLSAKEQADRAALDRAQALRMSQEASAAKLLERVVQQMAEFVYPIQQLSTIFGRAYEHAVFEAGCEGHTVMYGMEWISLPTQSYVATFNLGSPEFVKRVAANPFVYTLPPEDVARLAADPMHRARWEELVVHTMLPPLRELLPVIQMKVRTSR
jgi:hypothetical protein